MSNNDRFRFRIPMYSKYEERFTQFIYTDVYHEPLGFIGSAIFKTPEQCTGLKDKNGKLIWEGDIVKFYNWTFDEEQIGKVQFVEQDALYGIFINSRAYRPFSNLPTEEDCEIIGNIHENPELLGAKK